MPRREDGRRLIDAGPSTAPQTAIPNDLTLPLILRPGSGETR
jgi:hypothetical protein